MKTKNSSNKMLSEGVLNPYTPDSKSNTILSGLTFHVLLLLFMHQLIFGFDDSVRINRAYSRKAWVQYSVGVTFCHWIFLLSRSKESDANIGILVILVHFEKTLVLLSSRPKVLDKCSG